MYAGNVFAVVNVAPHSLYLMRKKRPLNHRLKNQPRINPAKAPDKSIFSTSLPYTPQYSHLLYIRKIICRLMWHYIETNVLSTTMKIIPEQMTSEVVASDRRWARRIPMIAQIIAARKMGIAESCISKHAINHPGISPP